MDAKSRADFINSVASGASIPCPGCGTNNKPDSKYCISCGAELVRPQEVKKEEPKENNETKETQNSTPAFESVQEAPAKKIKYIEPGNAFAQGLPDWSIEPPQIMVRRH
jgi:predicted RNA-binding Zn-ribbon protein involved in translation (DUF1610 family)